MYYMYVHVCKDRLEVKLAVYHAARGAAPSWYAPSWYSVGLRSAGAVSCRSLRSQSKSYTAMANKTSEINTRLAQASSCYYSTHSYE